MTAPWVARFGHSTVIDARTRAIYVIGGTNDTTYFNDVLVSTDGGARPDTVGWSGGTGGTQRARGVLGCTKGVRGVLEG
jgi:hypothetical protein